MALHFQQFLFNLVLHLVREAFDAALVLDRKMAPNAHKNLAFEAFELDGPPHHDLLYLGR